MTDEQVAGAVAGRPAPPLAHAWTLVKDLRWWADQIEKRSPVTPWELGLISLLQKAAYELEKAGPAPPLESSCKGCRDGLPVSLLDEDGVLTRISGKAGQPSHSVDVYWWLCTAYATREQLVEEIARLQAGIPTCSQCDEVILDNGDLVCVDCAQEGIGEGAGPAPLAEGAPPQESHESRSPDGDGRGMTGPEMSEDSAHSGELPIQTDTAKSSGATTAAKAERNSPKAGAGSEPADSHSLHVAEGAPRDWQRIETAPKDGMTVLGYTPSASCVCGDVFWNAELEQWARLPNVDAEIYPTHWMPLPQGPEVTNG